MQTVDSQRQSMNQGQMYRFELHYEKNLFYDSFIDKLEVLRWSSYTQEYATNHYLPWSVKAYSILELTGIYHRCLTSLRATDCSPNKPKECFRLKVHVMLAQNISSLIKKYCFGHYVCLLYLTLLSLHQSACS